MSLLKSPIDRCSTLAVLLAGCAKLGAFPPDSTADTVPATRFTSLIATDEGYCARTPEGYAWCWGSAYWPIFGLDNEARGVVEDGWVDDWMAVKRFGPGLPEILEASNDFFCWVSAEGEVDCAGGALPEFSGARVQRFYAAYISSAAVLADGTYEVGETLQFTSPPPPEFEHAVGDSIEVCYRSAGNYWTCPYGHSGVYTALDVAFSSICAIDPSGRVLCWDVKEPVVLVEGTPGWVDIAISGDFACGLTPQRTVECVEPPNPKAWQTTPWRGPVRAAVEPVLDIGCALYGSCCARLHTGELECWGFEKFTSIPVFDLEARP